MNAKTVLLIVLCFFLSTTQGYTQLTKSFEIKEQLFDPWRIYALNDDSLIVVDPVNDQQTLQLRILPEGTIDHAHRTGNGPGELASQGGKIVNADSSNIFVWDTGSRRMLVYNRDFTYQTNISSKIIGMRAGAVDSYLFASPSGLTDDFIRIFTLNGRKASDDPVKIYPVNVDKRLAPLADNFMLRQGAFLIKDEALFVGFDFSSIVAKITPDSIAYIIDKPAKIPLPNYQSADHEDGSTTFVAPDVAEYPHGTLSLDTDSEYLYVLHSGKQIDAGVFKQLWNSARGKINEMMEDLNYSTTVFVYDKTIGNYLGTLTLPQKARQIAVTRNTITALSLNEEGLPVIIGYEKENIETHLKKIITKFQI